MSKLYEQEYQAHNFWKGWHTLKEWAEFGFNCVVDDQGKTYYDGYEDGCKEYGTPDDSKHYELDYVDLDEDLYIKVFIKEAK